MGKGSSESGTFHHATYFLVMHNLCTFKLNIMKRNLVALLSDKPITNVDKAITIKLAEQTKVKSQEIYRFHSVQQVLS